MTRWSRNLGECYKSFFLRARDPKRTAEAWDAIDLKKIAYP